MFFSPMSVFMNTSFWYLCYTHLLSENVSEGLLALLFAAGLLADGVEGADDEMV
jgi:hypothetical protein